MKNLFLTLVPAILLAANALLGQSDRSIPKGFTTNASALAHNQKGYWLLGGSFEADETPGKDSVFLCFFDKEGGIVKQFHFRPKTGSESFDLIKAIPTSDLGVYIMVGHGLCDAVGGPNTIAYINPLGYTDWEYFSQNGSPAGYVEYIQKTADDKLIVLNKTGGLIINQTGGVEQQLTTSAGSPPLQGIRSDISENGYFITSHQTGLLFWKIDFATGIVNHVFTHTDTYVYNCVSFKQGDQYRFLGYSSGSGKKFYLIDIQDSIIFTPIPVQLNWVDDFTINNNQEIYYLERTNNAIQTLKAIDLEGNTIAIPNVALTSGESFSKVNIDKSNLVLTGYDKPAFSNTEHIRTGNVALIRFVRLNNPTQHLPVTDAALTNAYTSNAIHPVMQFSFYQAGLKDIRLQLVNKSDNAIVQNIQVKTCLGKIYGGGSACYYYNTKTLSFDGLNLLPGDSTWLDFGNFEPYGLTFYPDQFCFWLFSPNNQSDADKTNDKVCINLTSETIHTNSLAVWLAPNPATDHFTVNNLPESAIGARYELTDLTGKVISSGTLTNTTQKVETGHLPAGLYLFRAMGRIWKVVFC